MRVLYVNHTANVSGGELSLLTLLDALPPDVDAAVACPAGPLAEMLRRRGVPHHELPPVDGSLKLHAVHTSEAVIAITSATARLRRLASDFDVVHANSIRAGLIACLGAGGAFPPIVVHVRDCLPEGRISSLTAGIIGRRAAVVVANSRYTQERFAAAPVRAELRVVHNAIDLSRFDPAGVDRGEARAELGIPSDALILGVVGQLTPWKAQDDAVRVVAELRELDVDARLLLVGSAKFAARATRYDNLAFERHLRELIESLGVGDRVSLLGERDDVPRVLRALDLLLLPSWEEPFGRVVIEAMSMGVPPIATSVGGPSEVITDRDDGRLLPPRAPGAWARAIAELAATPGALAAMGAVASARARERYGAKAHADRLLTVYEDALAGTVQAAAAVPGA